MLAVRGKRVILAALCLVALVLSHLACLIIGARAVTKAAVIEMVDYVLSYPRGSIGRKEIVCVLSSMSIHCNNLQGSTGIWEWLAASLEDEAIK